MTSMAESARPWRLFWAVPLPDQLRADLSTFVADLQKSPRVHGDWRFTDSAGWHLTLAFLGGISQEAVEPMVERVSAAVAPTPPFELQAGGLGGFSGHRRARVLWYGVSDDGSRLHDLAGAVRAVSGLAPAEDVPFHAHVTLARSRDRHGAPLPRPAADPPPGRIPVDQVVLFHSHVGRGPSRYEAIARIPLRVPVHAGTAP